ncbi:MAG: hypothetical protein CMF54_07275 [Legionellales bacterium]|nr:hypothetical protein [Legionellales bacterium]
MKILQTMPCRVKSYQASLDGFNLTDTYLIAFNDVCNGGSNILTPAGYSDYVGSFLYVPFISKFFDLSIYYSTIFFFLFYGIFCILISLFGLFKFYNSKEAKIYGATVIIAVGTLCIFISDTYSFYGLTSLALITWWSKFSIFENSNYRKYFFLFIFTGSLVAFSNTVRGNSGNDVLLSIIFLIVLDIIKNKNYNKILIIIFIFIPILVINFQISKLQEKSKNYLINNTDIEGKYDLNFVRAIWHNAYYSLGYLSIDNEDVPVPTDVYSIKKAQEIKPDVIKYSKEYEKILRTEYFKFVTNNPIIFIKIQASKLGVIIFYIIVFLNIGIYLIFSNKFNYQTFAFFIPGILLNSLFGIASEPNYTYLLGLFAYSSLFATKLIEDKYSKF